MLDAWVSRAGIIKVGWLELEVLGCNSEFHAQCVHQTTVSYSLCYCIYMCKVWKNLLAVNCVLFLCIQGVLRFVRWCYFWSSLCRTCFRVGTLRWVQIFCWEVFVCRRWGCRVCQLSRGRTAWFHYCMRVLSVIQTCLLWTCFISFQLPDVFRKFSAVCVFFVSEG